MPIDTTISTEAIEKFRDDAQKIADELTIVLDSEKSDDERETAGMMVTISALVLSIGLKPAVTDVLAFVGNPIKDDDGVIGPVGPDPELSEIERELEPA